MFRSVIKGRQPAFPAPFCDHAVHAREGPKAGKRKRYVWEPEDNAGRQGAQVLFECPNRYSPGTKRSKTAAAKSKSAGSKPITPPLPSSSTSPSTATGIRAVEPDHLVLRPRKMRSGQRFSYLALEPEETALLTPPTTSASTATNPTSSLWIRRPSSKKFWRSWPASATSKKAWAEGSHRAPACRDIL